MTEQTPHCLYCNAGEEQIPLIALRYQAKEYWICPQHLPILIHKPQQLAGILPGIENVQGE